MLRRGLKYAYRNLLPAHLRRSLDLFGHVRASAEGRRAAQEGPFPEKNVLVLAPHPDDDVIGCGGTLHQYHRAGSAVTVVYLTDGVKGGVSGTQDFSRIRRDEAQKAASIIGINELVFLDHRDGELRSARRAVADISRILTALRPDAVYLPFFLDDHPDHLATSDIFLEASRSCTNDPVCYGYEVWTPIGAPNCIVDITRDVGVKISAMEQHASQIRDLDLLNACIGLSQYRSVISGLKNGNAEAFLRCPLTEYRRIGELVR